VLIHVDPADPEKYLRYIVPAWWDESLSRWVALDRGTFLPQRVFYDRARSAALSASQATSCPEEMQWAYGGATATTPWLGYSFDSTGVLPVAEAQVVLAAGHPGRPGEEPVLDALQVAGFWMNRFGAQRYFGTADGIIH